MKKLICFAVIMLVSLSAYATTLVVDQFNGPYYTINAAYNDAVDDDTILIYPGIYIESISISKEISLCGIDANSSKIQFNNVAIYICSDNVNIFNLNIIGNNTAIYVNNSFPTIENCIIEQSGNGISAGTRSFNLKNSIIKNCSNGIRYGGDGSINGIIINNIIHNCSSNGIVGYQSGIGGLDIHTDFYSNIIMNCNYGISGDVWCHYLGNISYNCFYNNNANVNGANLGTGNILSLNPLFEDYENGNYYIQSGSPCIDTGILGVEYEDLDGTRNDMGIFGGQEQWGSGNPTVLDIQLTPESVYPGETFDIEATGQIK